MFVTAGTTVSHRKGVNQGDTAYEEYPNIAGQNIELQNQDSGSANIIAVNQPGRLGVWPYEPDDDDHPFEDLAFTAVSLALGLASSKLSFGFSAAVVLASMAGSEQSDDGNTQTFGWTYTSDLPCEASNFCRFTMESFEGETTAHIHATQKTGQDMGGGFPEISFWNQVDADPNGGGGCEPGEPCPETDDKPQPGTDEYMDYLNRSENFLKVTAEEHPWRSAEEIEDRDGPFYISLNPRVSGGVIK